MRALFIEHDHVSLGGPIWRAFEKHGYEIERFLVISERNYANPNIKVTFPNFSEFDVVVPMGAPYGAYEDDRIGNWLLPELAKLKSAHNNGTPIFGICFGGQLMARALGGSVARSPKAELGWIEIESDDKTLIPTGPWFEYHWDRWTLPKGATEIARSEIASQAFVMGRTLGVQFHPEIDPQVLEEWLAMEGGCAEVESEGVDVEELRAQTKREQPYSDKRAFELVDTFLRKIATSPILKVVE
ncbi:MAG: aminotransferase [Methylophilaceae bacterium]|jgi:GMP synthase-like glutamine amidotransferase|nr:aminotransferase [Methylophilaceae bacterium]NDF56968.1 aminotransferase [Actinomycetota bacterium]